VIPANLLIPGSLFLSFSALLFLTFRLHWILCAGAFTAQTIIWMLLTVRGTHTFLSRFEKPPYWISSYRRSKPILPLDYVEFIRVQQPINDNY
jgi:hypothetical protein